MPMKTQQKKKEWDIHNYDHRLELVYNKAKKELSKRNLTLFSDYES